MGPDRARRRPQRAGLGPLMHACYGGNLWVVSFLLLLGADPSVTAVNGTTCLIKAAEAPTQYDGDHVAVIRLLLMDGRVPVDAQNKYGVSALWTACDSDETDIARVLLLEGGADHTIPGGHAMYDYETTPLEIAEKNNGGGGCVQLLQWFEGELQKAYLLSKARAVVDCSEDIMRAPEKAGAKTETEAQRAREEAAPAYLRGRVEASEALPELEVKEQVEGAVAEEEEEEGAVSEFVVRWLKGDLYVEFMAGFKLRSWETVFECV